MSCYCVVGGVSFHSSLESLMFTSFLCGADTIVIVMLCYYYGCVMLHVYSDMYTTSWCKLHSSVEEPADSPAKVGYCREFLLLRHQPFHPHWFLNLSILNILLQKHKRWLLWEWLGALHITDPESPPTQNIQDLELCHQIQPRLSNLDYCGIRCQILILR